MIIFKTYRGQKIRFYSKFLNEYEKILKKDQLFYKLYSANVKGLEVCRLALFFQENEVANDISSILKTHKCENEILVYEFVNLKVE